MNKIKIIFVCLLLPFLVLIFLKIKHKEEFQQKAVLAQEIHKILGSMMFDLREAREGSILDAPADGQWHNRIAFDHTQEGALEYTIKDGHLWRINNGKEVLIADHISDMRLRRQVNAPNILEVQIEARNKVSLVSNLRIRIRS
jgi:hypothetical protein